MFSTQFKSYYVPYYNACRICSLRFGRFSYTCGELVAHYSGKLESFGPFPQPITAVVIRHRRRRRHHRNHHHHHHHHHSPSAKSRVEHTCSSTAAVNSTYLGFQACARYMLGCCFLFAQEATPRTTVTE